MAAPVADHKSGNGWGGYGRPLGPSLELTNEMGISDKRIGRAVAELRCVRMLILFAMLALVPIAAARADAVLPGGASTEANVASWAMHWFGDMQAGRTDRAQYAPAYRAQMTDSAIKAMSHTLNQYGASPLRAEISQTRKIDNQTFYVVKFVFPRGDATSLLFGFDPAGKITGVGIGSLAGD